MATLVFATYIFLFLIVGAFVTETLIPKLKERK